ncbi:CDP-glucose 4,6-dehydratase [Comamonas aquatica]|uniref:CDP-glucose 4,6-dehydratase n=1 Tax=Comamonas aquatica TaxID=225991 RepID=A0AA43AW81_9BURK|nr:CDP-glucose 4,6-dehydratase [Comamonas aquatica]MDH1429849.1 CDP-glucose 4,6-dehydratase [Comamonas aquatica]MDH1607471.1 CDP-glucose 4,6-dehydratase [Comamonas aquatica]MDH1619215.1 CDP-glucose 4,6-dehydratase [Comamonas aquatica]MDH2007198.1 CDP-glucose 4,6-dehydratase [Comamonas aquatica]
MEKMGLNLVLQQSNPDFWCGKRVLMTGHTGFKGSWLSLWLQSLGATLRGIALAPPTTPALFEVARVAEGMEHRITDIRNFVAVKAQMDEFQPEIVFHMAAQPLVRLSYSQPVETYATNVMGTVHVLEAARHSGSVKAIVNITTDKCYENREWVWGYREDEPMGGHDPYSNSKGCAELVSSAYRKSFLQGAGIAMATARAGNVIGGGDWALDRLVPDILRALEKRESVLIRNPHAIRPWQHVLEPLSGYLLLAERLYLHGQLDAEGWNFGPRDEDARAVQWIVEHICENWGSGASWALQHGDHPHEASFLKLDISKARQRLQWTPRWSLEVALKHITEWQQAWIKGQDMRSVCLNQINQYGSSL